MIRFSGKIEINFVLEEERKNDWAGSENWRKAKGTWYGGIKENNTSLVKYYSLETGEYHGKSI